jgi:hypothetical protein
MASTQPPDTTDTVAILATETSSGAPATEDDGSGNLRDPDVQSETDLQSLLSLAQKSLFELQKKHEKMTFDLKIERQKTRQLEKDRSLFQNNCKKTSRESAKAMSLTIAHLKDIGRSQEKSKQECLKAKDLKYKECSSSLARTLKDSKIQTNELSNLLKKTTKQTSTISTLNADIMSKVKECDILKKDVKTLTTQVKSLGRRCVVVDERKHEQALQLKLIAKETETIKMRKFEQAKVLKEKSNVLDHERKLKTIEHTHSHRSRVKAKDHKRKQDEKKLKVQGGANEMGILHGELRKQSSVNGGCVPNPGTTSMSDVSLFTVLRSTFRHLLD